MPSIERSKQKRSTENNFGSTKMQMKMKGIMEAAYNLTNWKSV